MIHKRIYKKYPNTVEFILVLFVSFVFATIIERMIGISETNLGVLLSYLLSALIKIITFVIFGFIYYLLIKKKLNDN